MKYTIKTTSGGDVLLKWDEEPPHTFSNFNTAQKQCDVMNESSTNDLHYIVVEINDIDK